LLKQKDKILATAGDLLAETGSDLDRLIFNFLKKELRDLDMKDGKVADTLRNRNKILKVQRQLRIDIAGAKFSTGLEKYIESFYELQIELSVISLMKCLQT
jgi:hypothetical protein